MSGKYNPGNRKVQAARRVADKLKADGRHRDAQIVIDLCRSNSALIGLNGSQRGQIGELKAKLARARGEGLTGDQKYQKGYQTCLRRFQRGELTTGAQ